MGERIGMDISNMIWDRVVDTIQSNDFEGCKDRFIELFAMEVPFTEDELNSSKRDDLYERAFEAAISAFNRKTELLRSVAFPVIKQVYETQAEMYDNILIPISDGRLIYNVRVDLKEAYESEAKSVVREFEKLILLHNIDDSWKENLRLLDELKHSVRNVSYEQKDPLVVFKIESVKLFDEMVNDINNSSVSTLMRAHIAGAEVPPELQEAVVTHHVGESNEEEAQAAEETSASAAEATEVSEAPAENLQQPFQGQQLPGRNDPCPCGSEKPFKNCHGKGIV